MDVQWLPVLGRPLQTKGLNKAYIFMKSQESNAHVMEQFVSLPVKDSCFPVHTFPLGLAA